MGWTEAYTFLAKCVIYDSEAKVHYEPKLLNDKLISFYLCFISTVVPSLISERDYSLV